ncbi:fructose-6-phosphate aldolase [Crocosphaera chwakensis CCY0110]|uniref:Fructose-6-phosphate aldolase n=1 Tax=Crocosphaera chwakensis CCY0110 TaxID=391612 RepID=A3IMH9_9CHRO|nr:fructose-6-phosphate aldolase [Crocosphaera chwakensis CCY0110]
MHRLPTYDSETFTGHTKNSMIDTAESVAVRLKSLE